MKKPRRLAARRASWERKELSRLLQLLNPHLDDDWMVLCAKVRADELPEVTAFLTELKANREKP